VAEAHAKLVQERGLNKQHFDLLVGQQVEVLHELGMGKPLVDEVINVIRPLRAVFEASTTARCDVSCDHFVLGDAICASIALC